MRSLLGGHDEDERGWKVGDDEEQVRPVVEVGSRRM